MGNLQILLKSPEILPWKWVWSSWSVLIQNNFFKFSISQHLESFIHYFIHQLSSRLLRGHWQQNVHLNWCHSIFSFFTNFQLSVNRQKYFDPPSWISGAEWDWCHAWSAQHRNPISTISTFLTSSASFKSPATTQIERWEIIIGVGPLWPIWL